MPAFDGTGPQGQGPLTGRGQGPCAGVAQQGRGFGRGFGAGFGRAFAGQYAEPAELTKDEKKKILAAQLESLEAEKKDLQNRLKDIK